MRTLRSRGQFSTGFRARDWESSKPAPAQYYITRKATNVKSRYQVHRAVKATRPQKTQRMGPTPQTIVDRAHKLIECLSIYPQDIALSLARQPESSWLFGRLYLIGALTRAQYDAADRLSKATQRYRSLIAPHSKAKGFDPEALRVSGGGLEDIGEEASRKLRRAQAKYEHYYKVLNQSGDLVPRVIFQALDTDKPVPEHLVLIRRGLDALARYG